MVGFLKGGVMYPGGGAWTEATPREELLLATLRTGFGTSPNWKFHTSQTFWIGIDISRAYT